jgi:hypothetical protein
MDQDAGLLPLKLDAVDGGDFAHVLSSKYASAEAPVVEPLDTRRADAGPPLGLGY